MFNIISKQDGTFGLQRIGSTEVHGSFDTWVEAMEAAAEARVSDSIRAE